MNTGKSCFHYREWVCSVCLLGPVRLIILEKLSLQYDYLELLLKAGANPNLSNDKMQYPMHFAAFNNHKECVKILLKYDASTYVLDRKGRTPAEDTKDVEIRELILSSR